MASVTLKDVGKTYPGGVHAVRGVSIDVADGEFVVLVGPRGCGKSTTLRMIAGLEEATGGDISIGDRRVNDVEASRRDIAMVFQNYALYPHMTVRKNMEFGLKMRRTPKAEIKSRVAEAAAMLGLDDLLDRRPGELSGGQKQRVALGRAIVRQPAAFLFDEPLSNLDAKLRGEMRSEIAALHRRLGATMIYVTHDQVEAMTLGDRLVLMDRGVVQQQGAPIEVYNRPANRFVATFIGSPAMNLVDGEVRGGVFHATGDSARWPIDGAADGPATLGVRPEDLLIDDSGNGQAFTVAAIENVERLGHETLLHFFVGGRADGQPCVARRPGGAEIPTGGANNLGGEVSFTIRPDAAHLFAADSEGRRLN
ncbi:MAG: sn-glycerol-3-phosphate ABC transporter ATP-binding protein UgpC [Planctomycetota bacterium]